MCTAKGAGALAEQARARSGEWRSLRVLRGGCYGQCDLSPNVVIREHPPGEAPDPEVNRLSRTFEPNETVYALVDSDGLDAIIASHAEGRGAVAPLTLIAREQAVAPANDVAARIRALRVRKREAREHEAPADVREIVD